MLQFYALSVFVNIVAGLLIAGEGSTGEKSTIFTKLHETLSDKGVKFTLGLAALVVGLFKILTPTQGDLPVIGDLLPAASGLTTGAILLLDFFKGSSDLDTPGLEKLNSGVLAHRRYFGMGSALVGFLHFLLPNVPIF
jgi:hypothetical protein